MTASRSASTLPLDQRAIGYGHTTDEVAAVRVGDPSCCSIYHDAVHQQTVGYVGGLTDADFDRVVDRSWDPAVTLSVRLISVVGDTTDARRPGPVRPRHPRPPLK